MALKKTKERPDPAAEEETARAAADPEPEPDDILPWEDDFATWEEQERIDESTLTVTLYRMKPGKVKERVWRWTDEVPDEHEIGLQFGSGAYIIYAVVSAPGNYRKVRHRRFVLASSYDAERARVLRESGSDRYPLAGSAPAGGNPHGMGPEFMLGFMERILTAVLAGRAAAPAPDLSHWNQANEIVGKVVSAAAESQLKQSREVTALLAGAKGGSAVDEPEDGDFKDYLKDMIKEYGPSLIEAAGLKLKAAAGLVKRDEVFQSLSSDANLFGRVLNLLAKDPEVDKALAEKVLTKLKGLGVAIPLPAGFSFDRRPPAALNGSQAVHQASPPG